MANTFHYFLTCWRSTKQTRLRQTSPKVFNHTSNPDCDWLKCLSLFFTTCNNPESYIFSLDSTSLEDSWPQNERTTSMLNHHLLSWIRHILMHLIWLSEEWIHDLLTISSFIKHVAFIIVMKHLWLFSLKVNEPNFTFLRALAEVQFIPGEAGRFTIKRCSKSWSHINHRGQQTRLQQGLFRISVYSKQLKGPRGFITSCCLNKKMQTFVGSSFSKVKISCYSLLLLITSLWIYATVFGAIVMSMSVFLWHFSTKRLIDIII